jgi:hypothetical protein
MVAAGLDLERNRFDQFDALENEEDLEQLFEVLVAFRDANGRHPVLTAFSVVANPDFKRMKANGYLSYEYETLFETYKRIGDGNSMMSLWKQGIDAGIFLPQFHGREHLNIYHVMELFRLRNNDVLISFENQSCAGLPKINLSKISFVEAFTFDEFSQNRLYEEIISDGLDIFEKTFSFKARHFTSPGAGYHRCLNRTLKNGGIELLDVDFFYKEHQGGGRYKYGFNFLGDRNQHGQISIVRNCVFEPLLYSNSDGVNYCLQQIENAFKWNKPANISTHRVNFSGRICQLNRRAGLRNLHQLLTEITKRWPDVEFFSTVELGELMKDYK